MRETRYWLWLSRVFGVGSQRIWKAMCYFQSAKEAYENLPLADCRFKLNDNEFQNARSETLMQIDEYIENCEKKGIGLAGYSDEQYPPQLRHLFNPPAVLYFKGNISCLNGTRTVTSVGTRKASQYGLNITAKVCGELAAKNCVIVSGFAEGIDIVSNISAADKNRPTACVLGCGIEVDYPKPNLKFREKILNSGGVFISEFPPETPPYPNNFLKRNRILAALGRVTLVFEASLKSGSLSTANLSTAQGRELFVLPPFDIFSSRCAGNIQLLKEGATALYDIKDVLDCFLIGGPLDMEIRESLSSKPTGREAGILWYGMDMEKTQPSDVLEIIRQSPSGKKRKRIGSAVKRASEFVDEKSETPEKQTETAEDSDFSELSVTKKLIVNEMKRGRIHIDELYTLPDIDPSMLMTELIELEIMGRIRSLPGKMYELIR